MKIKKSWILMFLLFFIPLVSATVTVQDDFDDNDINFVKWDIVESTGNSSVIEASEILNTTVNNVSGQNLAYAQPRQPIARDRSGYVLVDIRLLNAPLNNRAVGFQLANDATIPKEWTGDDVTEAPCGVAVVFDKNGVRLIKMNPANSVVGTFTSSVDQAWHRVRIELDRDLENNQSIYIATYEGASLSVTQSDATCWNPEVNMTIGTQSSSANTADFWGLFDNFNLVSSVAGLGVFQEPCTVNADCGSGLCEYGFCGLKVGRYDCSLDEECISGQCVGGLCTKADAWTRVDYLKDSYVGDSTATNNFIALVIIIFVMGVIILTIKSIGAMIGAIFVGFMLTVFFTVVGWLSPFILIGAIFTGLVIFTLMFMIRGNTD